MGSKRLFSSCISVLLSIAMLLTMIPTDVMASDAKETGCAFDRTSVVDDVSVHVTASEGVLPDDARLKVHRIDSVNEQQKVDAAINNELPEGTSIKKNYVFDITIEDRNGNVVQPDTDKGQVQVSFDNIDMMESEKKDSDTEVSVYHIKDDLSSAKKVDDSSVTVEKNEVMFEAEHFSVYVVSVTCGDTMKEYSLDEKKDVSDILDDLNISYKTVTGVVSNNAAVIEVTEGTGENEGTFYVEPKYVGTARVAVTTNVDSIPINITVSKGVYVNGADGNDSNTGDKPSVDAGESGPVKTVDKAINNLDSTAGFIYIVGQGETIITNRTYKFTDKSIILKRYAGFDGQFFNISSNVSLTLTDVNIETDTLYEHNLVNIKENATLVLQDGIKLNDNGAASILSLEATTSSSLKPIELKSEPENGTKYALNSGVTTDGTVLVNTNGLEDVLKYFKLCSSLSDSHELALDINGNIIIKDKVTYSDKVYLDGVSGNDMQSGDTAAKAVKTYVRAKQLCKANNVNKIIICNTVTVNSTQTWEDAFTIEPNTDFTGTMISITAGTLTMDLTEVKTNGAVLADCNGGKVILNNNMTTTVNGGIGIKVSQLYLAMNSGNVIVSNHGIGVSILSGARFDLSSSITKLGGTESNSSEISVENKGEFYITESIPNSKLTGILDLKGKPVTITEESTTYRLNLSGFNNGDTVIAGNKVTEESSLNNFTLVAGSQKELGWDKQNKNGILVQSAQQTAVYLDPIFGDDSASGASCTIPVKSLDTALSKTNSSSEINTIYVMNPVKISESKTIGYVEGSSSVDKQLSIYPYCDMTNVFNVVGSSTVVKLGKVTLYSSYTRDSVTYKADGMVISGKATVQMQTGSLIKGYDTADTVITGARVKNGMLDVVSGTVEEICIDNEIYNADTCNGQVKVYKASTFSNGIYINTGAKKTPPILLGEALTSETLFSINLNSDNSWVEKEIVAKGEVDSAEPYITNFIVPTGTTLESGVADNSETATSLYIRDNRNKIVFLSGSGNDSKDGSTKANAVATYNRALELAKEEHKDIVICGSVRINSNANNDWEGVYDGDGNLVWTPTVYRDTSLINFDAMIVISSSYVLNLKDVVIDGGKIPSYGSAVNVYSGGTLNMESGSVIRNNNNKSFYGGGINVYNGKVNIDGGIIKGNLCNGFGGGIYADDTSTIAINRGKIADNTANMGGGVYALNSTIEMNGGTISNNQANSGGGVYFSTDADTDKLFKTNDGEICDNVAKKGGAIYIEGSNSRYIQNNCNIHDNFARGYSSYEDYEGGAIYSRQFAVLEIKDGYIKNNKSQGCAGGICLGAVKCEITGGEISNNSSQQKGGGIYVAYSKLDLKGGSIANNNSKSDGGGIYFEGAANDNNYSFSMSGGNIIGNAAHSGGGVFAGEYFDEFNISGGTISQNSATTGYGGGIRIYKLESGDKPIQISGGKISGNTATYGGGIAICNGNVNILNTGNALILSDNVSITNNSASYGGGLYAYDGGFITKGGKIFGNITSIGQGIDAYTPIYLQGSESKIDDTIYIHKEIKGKLYISSAMINKDNIYKVYTGGSSEDNIIAEPCEGVTDASQYINNFQYVKYNDSDLKSLEKSGNKIVLVNTVYVNGQTGSDTAVNAGESPANPRKTLPDSLSLNTSYYICGSIEIKSDKTITGNSTANVIRYTGFDVGGVPYTACGDNLFKINEGATLTLSGVNLLGKRFKTESYSCKGYLVSNYGNLVIKNGTTMSYNKKGCVYLATDKTIQVSDINTPGTQDGRITVDMQSPSADTVVVKGVYSNTNINRFALVPTLSSKWTMTENQYDLVIAGAKKVYLDAANEYGGDDANSGMTPTTPVATLEQASELLGSSGGVIYIMSKIEIATDITLAQDNISYVRYAKENSSDPDTYTGLLFNISGSGVLTLTDTVVDGNLQNAGSAGNMVNIESSATLNISGSTVLQNNAGMLISQNGIMTMTGSPVFDGIVHLATGKTIAVNSYVELQENMPLTLDIEDPPTSEDTPRTLITNTVMSPEFFALTVDGYGLKQNSVTIGETPTDCIVMTLNASVSTIYVNNDSGLDTNDGTTPATAVKTLLEAYEKLESTGGSIVLCSQLSISSITTLSSASITVDNNTINIDSGKSVCIKRYAKPTIHNEWSESYTGFLFSVNDGGRLTASSIVIDGSSKPTKDEPSVSATRSMIEVKAGGKFTCNSGLVLQNNNNQSSPGLGGAIYNEGVTKLSGVTISNCYAQYGDSVYLNGTLYVDENNSFGANNIYLCTGKSLTLTGDRCEPIIVTPQSTSVPVIIAKTSVEGKTGADYISSFSLDDGYEDYELTTIDTNIYMVKQLQQSSISINDKSTEYTGKAIPIDTAVVNGSSKEVSYTYYTDSSYSNKTGTAKSSGAAAYSGGAPKLPGTYYVKAEVEADENYDAASSGAILTITKATPTEDIFTSPIDLVYDRTRQDQQITYKTGIDGVGLIQIHYEGIDGTSYNKQVIGPMNVGHYKVTADVNEGDYYKSRSNIEVGTYYITQRPITVSGITFEDKVYDSNNNATSVTTSAVLSGLVTGDRVGVQFSTAPKFSSSEVGEGKTISWNISDMTLTGTLRVRSNYYIASDSQTSSSADITKKTLTATYTGDTILRNGTPSYTVEVTGFVGTETAANLSASDYTAPTVSGGDTSQFGTYPLTPTGGSAKNYTFSYVAGNLNVVHNPYGVTVNLTKNGIPYTGCEAALYQAGSKVYDLSEGDPADGVYKVASVEAGDYDIYVNGSDSGENVTMGTTQDVSHSISYNTVTYDANIPTGALESGTAPSDTKVYKTGATVTADILNEGNLKASNYNLSGWSTTTDGTKETDFIISSSNRTLYAVWTPKTVLTSAKFTGKTDKTYDGTAQTQNIVTAAGITSGETGSITVYYQGTGETVYSKSTVAPVKAGTYEILIDVTEGTKYASVTGLNLGTYTVNKKAVKVTGITAANKDYDTTVLAVTDTSSAEFEGIVSGDNLGVSFINKPVFATKDADNDKVVSWSISDLSLTGLVSVTDNYCIASDSQTSTSADISKKTLTATYTGDTILRNGTPSYTVEVTGFVGTETAENLSASDYTAPTVSGGDTSQFGTYPLTPTGGSAKNYTFSYMAGNLNVVHNPYGVTLNLTKNGTPYTGCEAALYQAGSKVYDLSEGDPADGVYKVANVEAGDYDIYVNGSDSGEDVTMGTTQNVSYSISYNTVTYDANIPTGALKSGTAPVDTKVYKTGSTVTADTLNEGNLKASNYNLSGWSTTTDGTKETDFIINNSNRTLYAIWTSMVTPTAAPTVTPTIAPTATPTAAPTATPTAAPTVTPTAAPTVTSTVTPTIAPTATPTATPTVTPTVAPTIAPTATPTAAPTVTPTVAPTVVPTTMPTIVPTEVPTVTPTQTIDIDNAPQFNQSNSSDEEDDIVNSQFSILKLRVIKSSKSSNTLKWSKATGADGYILYGNKCGKTNRMVFIKSFNKNTTKVIHSKLEKGTYYKYYMVAYKIVNGKKEIMCVSRTIHVPTLGGKYTDIKGVKVKKSNIVLKKGKKVKIKASEIKKYTNKIINRHVHMRYESGNSKIVTVSDKGLITALQKGTCYVYAYAQNGTYKKIRVKVK